MKSTSLVLAVLAVLLVAITFAALVSLALLSPAQAAIALSCGGLIGLVIAWVEMSTEE